MNPLANLATDSSIKAATDSVGTSYAAVDSGLYPATITMAFLQRAESGAMALNLTAKTSTNQEIKQTLWMTSGTAKGSKNYYEKDGEKFYLPGFIHANSLCLLTVGKEISEVGTEVKVLNQYNKEAKADVPTKTDVFVDLLGKEVLLGLIKQTVDKTKKNDVTGAYEPTGETREENELDKVFRAKDRMTETEILAQAEEANFVNTWEAKWKGVTRNKAKGTKAGVAGTVGGAFGAPANAAKKPAQSLFASA